MIDPLLSLTWTHKPTARAISGMCLSPESPSDSVMPTVSSTQTERYGPVSLDPYANAIAGREHWGHTSGGVPVRTAYIDVPHFDWGESRPPKTPWSETIVYELHVRSFTAADQSTNAVPGTYAALKEKIPYLQSLGITAVELLPIFEFEEDEGARTDPKTGEPLLNTWGYHPLSFCRAQGLLCRQHRFRWAPAPN